MQRSPASTVSEVTTAATAAGPLSNSTNPGASPRRTIEATSSGSAAGPVRVRAARSATSFGMGLGSVTSIETFGSAPIIK